MKILVDFNPATGFFTSNGSPITVEDVDRLWNANEPDPSKRSDWTERAAIRFIQICMELPPAEDMTSDAH